MKYTEIIYLISQTLSTDEIGNNVLLIPEYEVIVVGKNEKYGMVNSLGEEVVPTVLDSVYSQTASGVDRYFITITRTVEENGETVNKQETYNIEQLLGEAESQMPEINQNSINTNAINSTTDATNQVNNINNVQTNSIANVT